MSEPAAPEEQVATAEDGGRSSKLVPPCGAPGCTSPEKPIRLKLIPSDFTGDRRPGSTCYHSQRADCRRYFTGEQKGKPGRKAARTETVSIPQGKAISADPMPPIIRSLRECWGIRCAAALPLPCTA